MDGAGVGVGVGVGVAPGVFPGVADGHAGGLTRRRPPLAVGRRRFGVDAENDAGAARRNDADVGVTRWPRPRWRPSENVDASQSPTDRAGRERRDAAEIRSGFDQRRDAVESAADLDGHCRQHVDRDAHQRRDAQSGARREPTDAALSDDSDADESDADADTDAARRRLVVQRLHFAQLEDAPLVRTLRQPPADSVGVASRTDADARDADADAAVLDFSARSSHVDAGAEHSDDHQLDCDVDDPTDADPNDADADPSDAAGVGVLETAGAAGRSGAHQKMGTRTQEILRRSPSDAGDATDTTDVEEKRRPRWPPDAGSASPRALRLFHAAGASPAHAASDAASVATPLLRRLPSDGRDAAAAAATVIRRRNLSADDVDVVRAPPARLGVAGAGAGRGLGVGVGVAGRTFDVVPVVIVFVLFLFRTARRLRPAEATPPRHRRPMRRRRRRCRRRRRRRRALGR